MIAPALKKLLIDGRMVGKVGHGIAHYTRSLVHVLSERGSELGIEPLVLVSPQAPSAAFGAVKTVRALTPFLSPREVWELPQIVRASGASLYHSPSFASLGFHRVPWVQTVHDLIHLTYGSLAQKLYYQLLLSRSATGARRILTVSEFSRAEIGRWLEPLAGPSIWDRIDVVYNPVRVPGHADPAAASQALGAASGPFVLTLSNPKPHKNLGLLAASFVESSARGTWVVSVSESDLLDEVLGESTPWAAWRDRVALALKQGRIRALGGLDQPTVDALISGAQAFFFPSLYEGFGLPPVEAALAGVPVVVSDIPAHRESLGTMKQGVYWVGSSDLRGWVRSWELAFEGRFEKPSESERRSLGARFSEAAFEKGILGSYSLAWN